MSRAFVRESDGDEAGDGQPELPVSAHRNYVTPAGLKALEAEQHALAEERRALKDDEADLAKRSHLAQLERRLRYLEARLLSAIPVDPAGQPADEVAFGATVTVEDEDGQRQRYLIVGEDEADPAANRIAWISPLARALLGSGPGALVTWPRPAGDLELEVIAIEYER